MKRVTPEMLPALLSGDERTVLLFGAPSGEATMAQAVEFAEAWADCHDRATFGYVDSFSHVTLARSFGIRVLPTTLIMHGHDVAARFEGHCGALRIEAALTAKSEARAAA